MKITNVSSVDQLLENENIKKIVTENFKDESEFKELYDAIIGSNLISEDIETTTSNTKTVCAAGQNLNDLPLTINNNLTRIINGNKNLTVNTGTSVASVQSLYGTVSTNSNSEVMQQIYNSVNKYSKQYGVDPNLILAIIRNESNFQPDVVSSAGAVGLMQLMPITQRHLGVSNAYDIDENIRGGVQLISEMLHKYNGDVEMALMAYGAGEGTLKSRGVTSASEIYKMPEETQVAVPRVMKYYSEFRNSAV